MRVPSSFANGNTQLLAGATLCLQKYPCETVGSAEMNELPGGAHIPSDRSRPLLTPNFRPQGHVEGTSRG
jgi:hypothetical protein